MKKLILLVALILAAGLCFAQEDADEAPAKPPKPEFFDLEINIGVPVHWTNSPVDHKFYSNVIDTDKVVTANTAIGAALLFNFGRKIGLTLDADIFVGSDVMGHTTTDSYSNTLMGINALFGPVFYLYNGTLLRIPLAIGFHMYYWSSDSWQYIGVGGAGPGTANTWIKTSDFQIGPGAYLGIQFHFNRSLYIFSRTNVAVDLFRWHKVAYNATPEKKDSEVTFAWSVKPAIGVGIKF